MQSKVFYDAKIPGEKCLGKSPILEIAVSKEIN
jgi:hypothetical protein